MVVGSIPTSRTRNLPDASLKFVLVYADKDNTAKCVESDRVMRFQELVVGDGYGIHSNEMQDSVFGVFLGKFDKAADDTVLLPDVPVMRDSNLAGRVGKPMKHSRTWGPHGGVLVFARYRKWGADGEPVFDESLFAVENASNVYQVSVDRARERAYDRHYHNIGRVFMQARDEEGSKPLAVLVTKEQLRVGVTGYTEVGNLSDLVEPVVFRLEEMRGKEALVSGPDGTQRVVPIECVYLDTRERSLRTLRAEEVDRLASRVSGELIEKLKAAGNGGGVRTTGRSLSINWAILNKALDGNHRELLDALSELAAIYHFESDQMNAATVSTSN